MIEMTVKELWEILEDLPLDMEVKISTVLGGTERIDEVYEREGALILETL
jgi:hypothetical protein